LTIASAVVSIAQMPTPPPPRLPVVGPPQHGVAVYARDLAEAVAAASAGEAGPSSDADRTHLHVTDRLFGSTPEEAAERVELLAATTTLTITLHDVPQPSDGTAFPRRVAAYRRFVGAARGVVVNSRHEADLVREHLGFSDVAVVPIGTRTGNPALRPAAATPDGSVRTVMIAGFIYPGKGHLETILATGEAAGADGGERPAVVAIGSPSVGHERDVDELFRAASAAGVDLRVTGFLDAAAYRRAQRAPGVAVAAHQHVSASRSILDWAEAGRRALVASSGYFREMDALRPGTITLFQPEQLAHRIREAWCDPGATWLAPSTVLAPTLADVAADYRRWWAARA